MLFLTLGVMQKSLLLLSPLMNRFLLLLFSLFSFHISVFGQVNVQDSLALVDIYLSLDGPNWDERTFWTKEDMSLWKGVTTENGRVVELDLSHPSIGGNLSTSVKELDELRILSLSGTSLNGVPSELGLLQNLEELYLRSTDLSSISDDIFNLTNLKKLDIANNGLSGQIPVSIAALINLEYLDLCCNEYTGSIPKEFGELRSLKEWRLMDNNLTGSLPSELGSMNSLEDFRLFFNDINGEIPTSFVNLSSLRVFNSDADFCVPDDQRFTDWLNSLEYIRSFEKCDNSYSELHYDSLTLVTLYESTDGDNWTNNENWLIGPVESWYGVIVEEERVTEISLALNKLEGEIPSSLWTLTGLSKIDLAVNKLSGSMPDDIDKLVNLRSLELHRNDLVGSIPASLGSLSILSSLDLSDNDLSGVIPSSIGLLEELEFFFLMNNQLEGEIPKSISSLLMMRQMNLSGNQLEGHIPDELGNLDQLEMLSLAHNSLSGSIPPTLGNLNKLESLRIQGNELTGSMPTGIMGLSALQSLLISSNRFSGSVPIEIIQLSNLRSLNISFNEELCEPSDTDYLDWKNQLNEFNNESICLNQNDLHSDSLALVALYESTNGVNWTNNTNWLTGDLDTWYGVSILSGRIDSLNLSDNNLSGTIPEMVTELSELWYLNLKENSLTGTIPHSLETFKQLEVFDISRNEIDGLIPSEIGELTSLRELALNGNQITGNVPMELENLLGLSDLFLGANLLEGNIPNYLGNLSNLRTLDLSNNLLIGSIPAELGELDDLERLWLFGNQLGGNIPAELGTLSLLQQLFLSNNNITGEIPSELGNLQNLEQITLAYNNLSGNIPNSIGNLSKVWELNLSSNNFSGPIPISMGSLSNVRVVNLGFNQLSGAIPIELGNLPVLGSLSLRSNQLVGNIPDIFNLNTLYHLDLSSNELTGPVPTEVSNLTSLTTLKLQNNPLSGPLPSSITTLTNLAPSEYNAFDFSNTNLCEPQDQAYQDWKEDRNVIDNGISCNSDAEILTFSIPDQIGDTEINRDLREISLSLPFGSSLVELVVHFTTSAGASVSECGAQTLSLIANKDAQVYSYRPTVAMYGGVGEEIAVSEWTRGGLPTTKYGMFDFDLSTIPAYAEVSNARLNLYHTFSAEDPGHSQLSGSNEGVIQRITTPWTELVDWGDRPDLSTENQVILPASTSEDQNYPNIDVTSLVQDMVADPDISHGFNLKIRSEQHYRSLMFASKDHPNSELHPHLDITYSFGTDTEVVSGVTAIDFNEPVCFTLTSSDQQISEQWTVSVEFGTEQYSLYTDSLALVALYESTDGDNWINNDNWLTGDIDTWYGVALNADYRVSDLYLADNNLTGALPAEMGDLDQLRSINFGINNLIGEIPAQMSSLSKLEFLDMFANQLTGRVPPFLGQFTGLTTLHLSDNQFSGTIPPELGNLENLTRLALVNNALTGPIPDALGGLSSLRRLELLDNRLSGEIPLSLGNLDNLEVLYLNVNELTGGFPDALRGMTSLQAIDLEQNMLTGELPEWINELQTVQSINLNLNNFSGSIPVQIGELINLRFLQASSNNLSGPIPDEFGDLSSLEVLNLENNALSGEIPVTFSQLQKLERILLSKNELSGDVPEELRLLPNLVGIEIAENHISGLPDFSGSQTDLSLLVRNNKLSFEDLEPNLDFFLNSGYYAPQDSIGGEQILFFNLGSNITLNHDPVGGTSNTYQWYKSDNLTYLLPIDGANSPIIKIAQPVIEDADFYYLWVTSHKVPNLTLTSHPIELIYEPRSENSILSFTVAGEFAPADIDESVRSITIYLPCDAPDIAIPSFELSGGAQAFIDDEEQVSGVSSVDLSEPVTYNVVAEDGSEALWTVTVANPNPIGVFSTIRHLSSCNSSSGSIILDSIRLGSDQIVLLPNSRFSLDWSTTDDSHQIEVTSEGNYTVEVTDNETGCSYTRSFEVLTKDLEGALTLREQRDNTSCGVANGYLSVDANIGSGQGLDYAWYKGTTASGPIIERTKTIDSLEAGSYTLVVTDLDTDCTTSLTETIEEAQQSVDFTLTSAQNTSCLEPNGTIAVAELIINGDETTSTLGYRIEWSTTEDFVVVMQQTREVRQLAAGNYYARLIGVNTGCISPVRSTTVVDNKQELSFDLSITPNNRCDEQGNGSATLTGMPEQSEIAWYQGTTPISGQTSATISSLTSGNYQVVVTDEITGCSAAENFEINTLTPEFSVEVSASENTSCVTPNGSAKVAAVSINGTKATDLDAFSFEWWLADDEARLIQGKSADLEEMNGGEYFVQVTLDSIGCQSTPVIATITEQTHDYSVELVSSRPDLPESTGTGQLEIQILNAPETATISWYEGESPLGFIIGETTTLDNINAGKYTVKVTDKATGCDQIATYEVVVDERLAQTVSFDLPEIINIAELPLTLTASSDQGQPVSFEIVEGIGEVNDNQLTTISDGFITIRAYSDGTDEIAFGEALKTIRVVSDFYLEGVVTGAADGSSVSGEVVIFTLDGDVFASAAFTDGHYFIDGLPAGKYRILIEVTGEFNAVAFDTYYLRKLLWNRATIITLNDNTQVDVELLPKTLTTMTGQGTITGKVVQSDGGVTYCSRAYAGRHTASRYQSISTQS